MLKVEVRHISWDLNKSFNISRGSKKTAETIEVKIEDGQFCGYGECVPYNRYKETIESVSNEIDSIKEKIEDCIVSTSNLSNFIKNGAARNAIDCALWDLNCKKNNSTIWELMKIEKPLQLPGSYTVVLDEPEKMLEDVSNHKEFPTIKLKVNADNLEKILTKTRDLIPNQKLIVDANEAFNIDDLKLNADLFIKTRVNLIEQPLLSENDDELKGLNYPVSICADESFHDSSDLDEMQNKYDTINIKLDKTGGLSEALVIANEAKKLNLKIMLGCMVSSSLSMIPLLPLYQFADYIDLDGPCFISNDRENGLSYEKGMILLNRDLCWG